MRRKLLQIGGGNFIGGGRSKIIYQLCVFLNKEQYEVCYHIVNPLPDELRDSINNVLYIPQRFNNKILNLANDSIQFVRKLRKQRFDIIHFNTDSLREQWRYIVLAIMFSKSKIVIHGHNTSSSNSDISVRVFRKVLMFALRGSVSLYLACSKEAATYLVGNKYAEKVFILPNGIPINQYEFNKNTRDALRKELKINDKTFVIGSVGRLSKQKNYDYLVDIVYKLKQKNIDFKLLIVGEGELHASLQKKINELGMDQDVILLGMRTNVNEYLQAFDVFCLTSIYEGFGIVNIEAQAAGLPCIISDRCPQSVDVTGDVRFLSINDSPNVWSEAIIDIMNNPYRYVKNKLIKDKGFDICDSAKKLMKLYDEILV